MIIVIHKKKKLTQCSNTDTNSKIIDETISKSTDIGHYINDKITGCTVVWLTFNTHQN